jgi:hypothetical protein
MDTTGDGDERMVQVVTMLAVAGEVLTDLVKRFASATTDVRRPGQITASNFHLEIASDRAGEMRQAIQLFLRVS